MNAPSFMSGIMGVARITSPLMQTILSMSVFWDVSDLWNDERTLNVPWGLSSLMLTLLSPPNGLTLKTLPSIASALLVFSALDATPPRFAYAQSSAQSLRT